MGRYVAFVIGLLFLSSCNPPPVTPPPINTEKQLIMKGREFFFNETFNGNGRTCGTCHPFTNNFTLNAQDIAALPNDDPLFVAEFNPNLIEF